MSSYVLILLHIILMSSHTALDAAVALHVPPCARATQSGADTRGEIYGHSHLVVYIASNKSRGHHGTLAWNACREPKVPF